MSVEPVSGGILVLSWLVLCHLLADFVLQPGWVATRKFGRGPAAWRALGIHVAIVTAVAASIVLVYGLPGIAFVLVTGVTHLVIDRAKVELTLRMDTPRAGTTAVATPPDPSGIPTDGVSTDADETPELIAGWSPMPGVWFLLDQVAHLAVLVLAWAALLATAEPLGWWQDLVSRIASHEDGTLVGRVVLVAIVGTALVIANVRAGNMFVGTLVRAPRPPVVDDARTSDGPSVARIGATIGVIERVLIAALVLAGGVATIGLVIAAKTLARFRQLDDRVFAEYYLLGTLASVAFAVITSLIAAQVLR